MKAPIANPAAEVRPADSVASLVQLAATINAAHEAGERAAREGLESFREAGEALLTAKVRCGHGKWLPWLKNNIRFSKETAQAYMRVAKRWSECAAATNLRGALRLLTGDADRSQRVTATVEECAPREPLRGIATVEERKPSEQLRGIATYEESVPREARGTVGQRAEDMRDNISYVSQPPPDTPPPAGQELAPAVMPPASELPVQQAARALREVREKYGAVREFAAVWRQVDDALSGFGKGAKRAKRVEGGEQN
jgi:hypothetical protein